MDPRLGLARSPGSSKPIARGVGHLLPDAKERSARSDRASEPPKAGSSAESARAEYELSYSVRLVRPFLRVQSAAAQISPHVRADLDALDLDQRLSVAVVHQMLEIIVRTTGDDDIGLKAAQECNPGDGGVLDYAISSAATVAQAIDAAARYIRLVNDGLELRLETLGNEAFVRLENQLAMPRAGLDFQVGATFRAFSHIWASGALSSVRVLFSYPAPDDMREHTRTFGAAPIEFGAPFSGFVFDGAWLPARLASADVRLHDMVLQHAENMLAELPRARPLTERVRSAILAELAGGNPSITVVAPRLHISPRTLERRLEREGTTFSTLLDDLRKRLALRYVASRDLELAEIAFLLGFSKTTAFHRAFKRWTGQTPLYYRRQG